MKAKDLKVGDVFDHGNKIATEVYRRGGKVYITYRYRAEGMREGSSIWHPQRVTMAAGLNKELHGSQLRMHTARGMKPWPYYVDEQAQVHKLAADVKNLLK